jgi:hypothetical protein
MSSPLLLPSSCQMDSVSTRRTASGKISPNHRIHWDVHPHRRYLVLLYVRPRCFAGVPIRRWLRVSSVRTAVALLFRRTLFAICPNAYTGSEELCLVLPYRKAAPMSKIRSNNMSSKHMKKLEETFPKICHTRNYRNNYDARRASRSCEHESGLL